MTSQARCHITLVFHADFVKGFIEGANSLGNETILDQWQEQNAQVSSVSSDSWVFTYIKEKRRELIQVCKEKW